MGKRRINAILDLQYGSTGKGLFAGFLALRDEPDTVIAAWGPNSGHTFMSKKHGKMVNIALPNGIISPKLKRVLIGPGAVINPALLQSEIEAYVQYVGQADILIHSHAAVVTEMHRQIEAEQMVGIGSTMKGVGEAMIQKIRRNRANMNIAAFALRGTPLEGFVADFDSYNNAIRDAEVIQLEGCQGYSLSINHGFYPYTTSRDCTKWQLLADCGMPGELRSPPNIYGVARTYPIRVANRERGGAVVGWSGPCYPDQREIEWEDIGVEPELTTVTRLPRRIFTFSMQQIEDAVRANGSMNIFLNFLNYDPRENGFSAGYADLIRKINDAGFGHWAGVTHTGWGPDVEDIRTLPGAF